MTVSAVTLLPDPDSPTIPSVRPRSTEREMPSTALHDAVARREANAQVLDLEQRHSVPDPRVEERVDDVDERCSRG